MRISGTETSLVILSQTGNLITNEFSKAIN